MSACADKNTTLNNVVFPPTDSATTFEQEQKPEEQEKSKKDSELEQEQKPEEQEESNKDSDIVEIKEKMFITQIYDIYLNTDDYMDKKIQLEGFYDESYDEQTMKTYKYIIRKSPGCCGNDGVAGFEFIWDGECPKANDWLKIIGIIEIVKENGNEYLHLKADTLEVLEKRGAEFVAN